VRAKTEPGRNTTSGPAPQRRAPTRADLERLVRRVVREVTKSLTERLLEALERHMETPSAPTRDAANSGRPRRRRDPEALSALEGQALELLDREGGTLAIGDMARALGVPRHELVHPLKRLVAEGLLVRSGARRGVKYQSVPRSSRRRKA
jgi:hypothetical protein